MRHYLTSCLLLVLFGCAADPSLADPESLPFTKVEPGKEDSSAEAIFLTFAFDGELHTTRRWGAERQIEDQLLFTIGQLNGDRGVSRLDNVRLTEVTTDAETDGEGYRVRYHAEVPVAWGRRTQVPSEYTFQLPRDVSSAGQAAFAERYGHRCVDTGAHDVDAGSMWYYYRPSRSGCSLREEDVLPALADVSVSEINTTGRFPEYDRIYEDDALRIVAVFGKYEDGATSSSDAGIAAYNRFLREIRRELAGLEVTTVPAELPTAPGIEAPDIELHAALPGGRSVDVFMLLVDNVRTAGATFGDRYGELSRDADMITYNGHAGLGSNIRALARRGRWETGQYAVVFMNGCDTYAYVDRALWDAHAEVNADDPTGTRYLDIVMNAMPAYFREMPRATMALVRGLMSYEEPRTYEQIFADVDSSQIVMVSGEADNTYTPGGGGEPTEGWAGHTYSGALGRGAEYRFATPTLPAGRYSFEITGEGDADLYVRIGSDPTSRGYDCRPYRSDANERCEVELPSESTVHLMVRGYTDASFDLVAGSM